MPWFVTEMTSAKNAQTIFSKFKNPLKLGESRKGCFSSDNECCQNIGDGLNFHLLFVISEGATQGSSSLRAWLMAQVRGHGVSECFLEQEQQSKQLTSSEISTFLICPVLCFASLNKPSFRLGLKRKYFAATHVLLASPAITWTSG